MTLRTWVWRGGSSVRRISGRGLVGSCHGREALENAFQSSRPGGDMLVAAEHVRAVGQPHHGRELAQRVVHLARIDHRFGREDVERVFGDRLAHRPSPSNRTSPSP